MAQTPLLLDAIQIEPESGDTITISRGVDGDLDALGGTGTSSGIAILITF